MNNAVRNSKAVPARNRRQQGFALPLALVAIALLSAITLAGYRSVSGAAEIVSTVQDNARMERAFFSAEAESTFVFLTSPAAPNGILTGSEPAGETDPRASTLITETLNTDELTSIEFWRADGQARIAIAQSTRVTVIYHDAAGFPPIDVLPEGETAVILEAAGFDANAALQLAARIWDYQDDDTRRRFRGAERADYRLYSAAPPTNSPLRAPGELASVLGFGEEATARQWDFLIENMRFGGLSTQFKPHLGPPAVAALFASPDTETIATDPLDTYAPQNVPPTGTARFLLAYRFQDGLTGKRAVEIMRTAVAADRPFRRIWIYDKVENDQGEATPAIEQGDMAPVFQAAADSGPR